MYTQQQPTELKTMDPMNSSLLPDPQSQKPVEEDYVETADGFKVKAGTVTNWAILCRGCFAFGTILVYGITCCSSCCGGGV